LEIKHTKISLWGITKNPSMNTIHGWLAREIGSWTRKRGTTKKVLARLVQDKGKTGAKKED